VIGLSQRSLPDNTSYEGWNFKIIKGLSPCDFDLIPKMKEPLRGIRFRTIPEIL